MNIKNILTITFKVAAAVVAAGAVFISIGEAVNSSEDNKNSSNKFTANNNSQPTPTVNNNTRNNGGFTGGLRAAGDTCSKLGAAVSALTGAIDCFSRVFSSNNSGNYSGGYGPVFNYGPFPQGGNYIDMGNGQYWERVSPYIVNTMPGSYCAPPCYPNYNNFTGTYKV